MRPEESSSSNDEDGGDDEGDSEAFKEWLRRKKEGPEGPPRHPTGYRPIHGLIKIGSTAAGDGRNPDPIHNIRAYRDWLSSRRKGKKLPNEERMKTVKDFNEHKKQLEEKRQELLLTAISYDEWMDHSEDRKSIIRRILRADLDQLNAIEEEKQKQKAPRQISHQDWSVNIKKRQEEERARQEVKQKQEEENNKWRQESARSSAAISHNDWLTLKRTHAQMGRHAIVTSPRESTYGSENTRKEAEIAYDRFSGRESRRRLPETPREQEIINPIRHRRVAEIASY